MATSRQPLFPTLLFPTLVLAACRTADPRLDDTARLPFDSGQVQADTDSAADSDSGQDTDTTLDSDTGADTACAPANWYPDADGDGFGDASAPTSACVAPAGDLADGSDCDDTSPDIYPGATDVCADGIDSNCDGVDKACPVDIEVSAADATFFGASSCDLFGVAMDGVGDLTGDGIDDIALGGQCGTTYVFPGPVDSTTMLDSAFQFTVDPNYVGSNVVGAGDLDGDGQVDVLISEAGYETDTVAAVLGPVTASGNLETSSALVTNDTIDNFGGYGAAASNADVDGDGRSDALLGAPFAGLAYLLRGPMSSGAVGSLAWATFTGLTHGHVALGGDLDGDGLDDVILEVGSLDSGSIYVWSGVTSGTFAVADAPVGWTADGAGDGCGQGALESKGDVNGDGYADLLVGAHRSNRSATEAGAAYLVLGPLTTSGSLADADAILEGENAYAWAGEDLSNDGGDVNGDGRADILVGSPYATNTSGVETGVVHLLYGPVSGVLNLADADVNYQGDEEGELLYFVSTGGDLNSDGFDEVLIGSEYYGDTGVVYLFFGG